MASSSKAAPDQRLTTRLLLAGGAVGPLLFIVALLIEGATRPGYNAWNLPGSSLSLGQGGWMQTTNFIFCGILVLGFASGLKRVLSSGTGTTWGSVLLGIFGLALIAAGLFVTDPIWGYPPGAASNGSTLHGAIHNVCGLVAFSILPAALFVFARRFAGDPAWKGWTIYSVAAGVLTLVFFVAYFVASILNQVGTLSHAPIGLFQRLAIIIGWTWVAFFALRLLRNERR